MITFNPAEMPVAGVQNILQSAVGPRPIAFASTNFLQLATNPFALGRLLLTSTNSEAAMKDIILEPKLDRRLRRVAISTSNTKKNNAPA
jgi:hypothetical protein